MVVRSHYGNCVSKQVEVIVDTTRITVPPDKRNEFLETIRRLIEPIKAAKGCLTFSFYVDAADENTSLLMSEWETEVDLKNYLDSDECAILRGAITILSTRCTGFRHSLPT